STQNEMASPVDIWFWTSCASTNMECVCMAALMAAPHRLRATIRRCVLDGSLRKLRSLRLLLGGIWVTPLAGEARSVDVVVLLVVAETHRVRWLLHPLHQGRHELFLGPDQVLAV